MELDVTELMKEFCLPYQAMAAAQGGTLQLSKEGSVASTSHTHTSCGHLRALTIYKDIYHVAFIC